MLNVCHMERQPTLPAEHIAGVPDCTFVKIGADHLRGSPVRGQQIAAVSHTAGGIKHRVPVTNETGHQLVAAHVRVRTTPGLP